jgi:hypothetical protein
MYPAISCYCATYGRSKAIIENNIKCFLDQEWPGKKELVILNDCKYQKFIFDHPEVKIYNIDEKIPILGKKFNETVKLCSYEYIATWEDDDSFLKHRLFYSFNNLMNNQVYHTYDGFIEKNNKNITRTTGYFHSTHLLCRNIFDQINGYPETDLSTLDTVFMSNIAKIIPNYTQTIVNNSDIFYVYNWTFNSYHASSSYLPKDNLSITIEDQTKKLIDSNKIESGAIYLEPKLRYNYYDFLPT